METGGNEIKPKMRYSSKTSADGTKLPTQEALEASKVDKAISQITLEFGFHLHQLRAYEKEFLENM